jgi:hypothetical protein
MALIKIEDGQYHAERQNADAGHEDAKLYRSPQCSPPSGRNTPAFERRCGARTDGGRFIFYWPVDKSRKSERRVDGRAVSNGSEWAETLGPPIRAAWMN